MLCWQSGARASLTNKFVSEKLAWLLEGLYLGGFVYDDKFPWLVQKMGHFVAFMVLSMFGFWAVEGSARSFGAALIWASLLNLFVALMAEFGQSWAVGRTAIWRDAWINVAGSGLGMLLGMAFAPLLHTSQTKNTAS